jgi:peptidoglycan hydrolase CwlO-like protein
VQALSLMKACANKSSMVAEQGAWVVELEDSNDRLLAELEQVHLALNEAIAAQNSLFVSYEKLEEECIGLHAAVDTLEQEKAKTATDHEAEVAATHKKKSRLSHWSPQEASRASHELGKGDERDWCAMPTIP